jgi:hypothetical protein
MSTVEKKEPTVSVAPFTVEADHPRNCDLLLQNIPGGRLRGAIRASKSVETKRKGKKVDVIPKDQARHLGMLPEIPGMRVSVNPAKGVYIITDPLSDDEDLVDQINQGLLADERIHDVDVQGVQPVPDEKGKLDRHQMKTLCRELVRLKELGHIKEVDRGNVPSMKQVDKLPGKYLLNPGAQIPNGQPRYEEDLPAWVDALNRTGS